MHSDTFNYMLWYVPLFLRYKLLFCPVRVRGFRSGAFVCYCNNRSRVFSASPNKSRRPQDQNHYPILCRGRFNQRRKLTEPSQPVVESPQAVNYFVAPFTQQWGWRNSLHSRPTHLFNDPQDLFRGRSSRVIRAPDQESIWMISNICPWFLFYSLYRASSCANN